MALLKIHSRMWLIPIFAVLLLWGCGDGLVNGEEHATLEVDDMGTADVEFNTEIDEEDGSMTFTFTGNSLAMTLVNIPSLGDKDLEGGGMTLRVNQIDVTITDVDDPTGVYDRLPYNISFLIPPEGSEAIVLNGLLPMSLTNKIVERYLWAADICNTLYVNDHRLDIAQFSLDLAINVTELTPYGESGETYTKHVNGNAFLTHTGDYNYPITTVPDLCSAP